MTFLESYYQAISIQQQRQTEEFNEMQSLPLAERVLKGNTMINLTVEFEYYDGEPDEYCDRLHDDLRYIKMARVRCLSNLSKFREGSTVQLSHGQYCFNMEIVQDSIFEFILAPNVFERRNCYIDAVNHPVNNWQIDAIDTNITYKMFSATGTWLDNHPTLTQQISDLIEGRYTPKITMVSYHNELLNESQNKAIAQSLGTDYVHLIQGPPGTGKTHTIGYLCQQLLTLGCSVFISAPTHTAINNCLEKIAQVVQDPRKVVKVGERYQADDLTMNEYVRLVSRLPKTRYQSSDLSQECIAIGATPYSLCYPASKKLDGWTFDYAIIDEAAQMSIPMSVAVMSKCRHIIFVGDHQQLSPIIPSDCDNVLFSCSIFQHLASKYGTNLTLLTESYRLNPQLLSVPNQLFYGGKLQSNLEVNNSFQQFICRTTHAQLLTNKDSLVLFLHDEFDGLGHSPYEAAVVSDLVSDLLANHVALDQIGILTPYRAQVREIRQTVYQRGVLNEEEVQQLFVDTVDRMQGQEREYIIYTLANPNPIEVEQRLEFFYNANRLNVAITRAKIKCIVIANAKVFATSQELLKEENLSDELRQGVLAFTEFYKISSRIHFDPFDDSSVWL